MATLIFKSKQKIVITDYVDYPVLHITIKYTGIFSRIFSVVLHASLAIICLSKAFLDSNTSRYDGRLKFQGIIWRVLIISQIKNVDVFILQDLFSFKKDQWRLLKQMC